MAEITPGRARAAKEILIFEDFEAITHHAKITLTSGSHAVRSPDAAYNGHAGLECFAPAAANAYAHASWATRSTKNPLISMRLWIRAPLLPVSGYIIFSIQIQKRSLLHNITILYDTSTQKWMLLNENGVYEELTAVTTVLEENVWYQITIEVDTGKQRVLALHINEESYRFNRAYYVITGSWASTYMLAVVQLSTSAAGAGKLHLDDLIVQEL
jgi:hypothetical protein